MKKIIYSTILSGALILGAAACSQDSGSPEITNRTPVKFSTDALTRSAQTRADDEPMAGIYMLRAGQTLSPSAIAEDAANRGFTANETGGLFPTAGKEIYYPMDGSDVDFILYSPYTDAVAADYTIQVDVTDQTKLENSPLVYSNNARSKNKNSGEVALECQHKLAQMKLSVTAGDGIDAAKFGTMTTTLSNVPTAAKFSLVNGQFGEVVATGALTSVKNQNNNIPIILIPHVGTADRKVTFNIDGKEYIWTIPASDDFQGGNIYEYPITITRHGVEPGTATIEDWKMDDAITGEPQHMNEPIKFADAAFKEALLGDSPAATGGVKIDTNGDGEISFAEAMAFKGTIDVSKKSDIKSLSGIENFTALTTLHCSSTGIKELDVKNNTALNELSWHSNTQLASLNVSGCTALKELDCQSNEQLTSLNVSGCEAMTKLNCRSTSIKELDVSGLGKLTTLYCNSNKQLILLNVSGCAALDVLLCYETGITQLDVSGLGNLTNLDCDSNSQLTSLNVSGCAALDVLLCYSTGIKELDVSGLDELRILNCPLTGITQLDVSGLDELQLLNCSSTGIKELDVSGLDNLTDLSCHSNAQLTSLNVSGCAVLNTLECYSCPKLLAADVSACASPISIRWYNSGDTKDDGVIFQVTRRNEQTVNLHNSSGTIYQPSDKVELIVKK